MRGMISVYVDLTAGLQFFGTVLLVIFPGSYLDQTMCLDSRLENMVSSPHSSIEYVRFLLITSLTTEQSLLYRNKLTLWSFISVMNNGSGSRSTELVRERKQECLFPCSFSPRGCHFSHTGFKSSPGPPSATCDPPRISLAPSLLCTQLEPLESPL